MNANGQTPNGFPFRETQRRARHERPTEQNDGLGVTSAARIRRARGRALAPAAPAGRMDTPEHGECPGLTGLIEMAPGTHKPTKSPMGAPKRDRGMPLVGAGPDAEHCGWTRKRQPAGDDGGRAA